MSEEVSFLDILEPRRTESGIFCFMTRRWDPQKTMILDKYCSPQDLKDIVAKSVYLDTIIDAESTRSGVSKSELQKEVLSYLEEMGLDKKVHVIRWMGIVFLKICFMMKIKLYVNNPSVMKLKSIMGNNPVLFLPTHRSYADFCLMTYLCFHYDIDLPAVAAGMDFYSMAVVGQRMRETCAFYIRRSLVGAPIYAATLRQYVRTAIVKHCAPIEFFLEGTRSRSNKSLPPKYGMLSMTLVPFFAREVSDITIVPVNISYDRLMEHGLFAYEHLGVPKPKESTGGLLKALRTLNDNFGNIYINLGTPLSLREYVKDVKLESTEFSKPVDLQQLTPDQFKLVQNVAEHVITLQQKNTVATVTNITALALMQCLIKDECLKIDDLVLEVEWLMKSLAGLGASVFENNIRDSIEQVLLVHNKMMRIDRDGRLRLISEALIQVSSEVKEKMKGHILDSEKMAISIPVIQLQLYVNPVLHYMVPPALIYLIARRTTCNREQLTTGYTELRKMLRNEFFYVASDEDSAFNKALEYCIQNNVISQEVNSFKVSGGDKKLQYLLSWSVWPALTTLKKCAEIMTEQVKCEHKQVLKLIQQRVESNRCHPYCLSLEATANCLQGLVNVGALVKDKQENTYEMVPGVMEECHNLVSSVLPIFNVEFGRNNTVIVDEKTFARL